MGNIRSIFMLVIAQLTYIAHLCNCHSIEWFDCMLQHKHIMSSFADCLYQSPIVQNVYPSGDPIVLVGMVLKAKRHMQQKYIQITERIIDNYPVPVRIFYDMDGQINMQSKLVI